MSRPRTAAERVAAAEARRARRSEVLDATIVVEAAAALLAVRQRTVSEARARLRRMGYPSALCDQAVTRLAELGYLDDDAYARAWVEARDRARPRGEAALRRELSLRGIARETIDAVLRDRQAGESGTPGRAAGADGEPPGPSGDLLAARSLLSRRLPALSREPDPRRRRQRAYALLARNGFDPDVCSMALELLFHDTATLEAVAGQPMAARRKGV